MGRRCRQALVRFALGLVAAGSAPVFAAPAGAKAEEDRAALASTLADNAWLKARAELAADESFYLVLDAETRSLRLMHGGALLHETPVLAIELGTPQRLFVRSEPPPLEPRIWSGAELDPPANWQRTVITPPPPDATEEEEVAIPPTPDEAFPAPPRFRILYDGGLALEIVAQGSSAQGLWSRLRDAFASLGFGNPDRVRLRLVLEPADCAAFYRSLPPETRFLFVPEL